jgi:hypothetical protein
MKRAFMLPLLLLPLGACAGGGAPTADECATARAGLAAAQALAVGVDFTPEHQATADEAAAAAAALVGALCPAPAA